MKFIILSAALLFSSASFACEDFNGFWAGACNDSLNSPTDYSKLAIEQVSCDRIHWGSHPIIFGYDSIMTWYGAQGHMTRTDNVNWSDAHQTMLAGSSVVTVNGNPFLDTDVEIYKSGTNEMTIDFDGSINLGRGSMPYRQTCVYSKQ